MSATHPESMCEKNDARQQRRRSVHVATVVSRIFRTFVFSCT
jgi:hypothetical protein